MGNAGITVCRRSFISRTSRTLGFELREFLCRILTLGCGVESAQVHTSRIPTGDDVNSLDNFSHKPPPQTSTVRLRTLLEDFWLHCFMLNSRLQAISEESHYLELSRATEQSDKPQHGSQSSYCLLGIPAEMLTGCTAYLDPPSLFSLAKVNTALYYHVKDDNTWRWAFASRYLGFLSPGRNTILLRRSQLSWRNEFIARFRLERCAVPLSGVMVSFTDD